jgi:hypothetical protein
VQSLRRVIEDARAEFKRAMTDPDNLRASHRALRRGPGRRFREVSINRAIVVLTVAAWQAYVEDLLDEIVEYLRVSPNDPAFPRFRVILADCRTAIHRFSTPNAEGTRELLMRGGFDPWPSWSWGGRWSMQGTQVRERMNQWLQVRHAIAHGDADLPHERCLSLTISGDPTLTLANAESCIAFFQRVVNATTDAAIAAHP